jgi:hypothetical protein
MVLSGCRRWSGPTDWCPILKFASHRGAPHANLNQSTSNFTILVLWSLTRACCTTDRTAKSAALRRGDALRIRRR